MNDNKVTLAELKKSVDLFLQERDWHQFHSPRVDSNGIAIEAAELMEIFLFTDQNTDAAGFNILEAKREAAQDEIADILMWVLCFSLTAKIDLTEAFQKKMEKNRKKYPVEKCKGKTLKYTDL